MNENNLFSLKRSVSFLGALFLFTSFTSLHAQQPLETETARPIKKGYVEFQSTFEYQTSKEGKEYAIPFAFEYGITDRLSLLVEPVAYTKIRPKTGTRASGIGDLEITLSYLVAKETKHRPAFSIAGEFKLPTTKNTLIGTGKTDFAAYIFASKRFGKFDTHMNVGYTFVGKPKNIAVSNTLNLAFASEYSATKKFSLVGEFLVNGIGRKEAVVVPGTPPPTVAPEAAAGELVGTIGFRYKIKPNVSFSLGVSRDNSGATLLRPGITYTFKLPGRK